MVKKDKDNRHNKKITEFEKSIIPNFSGIATTTVLSKARKFRSKNSSYYSRIQN